MAAVQACAGKHPAVIGKPSPIAFEALQTDARIDPDRCLIVGDKLETDILFGRNCGLKTLLVETGIHSEKDALGSPPEKRPGYIASSVAVLTRHGQGQR